MEPRWCLTAACVARWLAAVPPPATGRGVPPNGGTKIGGIAAGRETNKAGISGTAIIRPAEAMTAVARRVAAGGGFMAGIIGLAGGADVSVSSGRSEGKGNSRESARRGRGVANG